MIDFVITGTGRCGTGFTSQALNSAGLAVGHEGWFAIESSQRRNDIVGDVSWLAVPELEGFKGAVVHQVRHPVEVVRSLVGIKMFSDRRHGPYRWFMFANQPGLVGDDMLDAITWWVSWNERIEQHATMRVRLRDLDAALLADVAEHVGHPVEVAQLLAATTATGTNVNARERADDVSWDALPAGPMTDRMIEMAARYGYEVP